MKLLLPLEDRVSQKTTSKSAKHLYRPIGLVSGVIGGLIASQAYRQVWKRVAHNDRERGTGDLGPGSVRP
jgi:hypothetical protein